VPLHLLGVDVQVRWDARLIRVFHQETMVAVHAPVRGGNFAPRAGGSPGPSSTQRAYMTKLVAQCACVGPELVAWAEAAYAEREIRALRLIQGALALVRKHPKEVVLGAAKTCLAHRLFRYRDLCRFIEIAQRAIPERRLTDVHDDIRSIHEYRLEVIP
jgi:hypothetical protein